MLILMLHPTATDKAIPKKAVKILEAAWETIPDQLAIKGRLVPTMICAYSLNGNIKDDDLLSQYSQQWYPIDSMRGGRNIYSPHSYWGITYQKIKYLRNSGSMGQRGL